jgi:flagellar hook-basal body complex protein FliE
MADPIRTGTAGALLRSIPKEIPGLDALTAAKSAGADGSFGDLFTKAINEASGLQDRSRMAIESFVRGEPIELHQVMAAAEEASISLELLVEIRNKLTEAYRTVMNMQ